MAYSAQLSAYGAGSGFARSRDCRDNPDFVTVPALRFIVFITITGIIYIVIVV